MKTEYYWQNNAGDQLEHAGVSIQKKRNILELPKQEIAQMVLYK
jgi:hypothetical protein